MLPDPVARGLGRGRSGWRPGLCTHACVRMCMCERERQTGAWWLSSVLSLFLCTFLPFLQLLLLAHLCLSGSWSPDQLQVFPRLFGDFPGHCSLSPRDISSPKAARLASLALLPGSQQTNEPSASGSSSSSLCILCYI